MSSVLLNFALKYLLKPDVHEVFNIISDVVCDNHNITKDNILSVTSRWLSGCVDRDGGRVRRAAALPIGGAAQVAPIEVLVPTSCTSSSACSNSTRSSSCSASWASWSSSRTTAGAIVRRNHVINMINTYQTLIAVILSHSHYESNISWWKGKKLKLCNSECEVVVVSSHFYYHYILSHYYYLYIIYYPLYEFCTMFEVDIYCRIYIHTYHVHIVL